MNPVFIIVILKPYYNTILTNLKIIALYVVRSSLLFFGNNKGLILLQGHGHGLFNITNLQYHLNLRTRQSTEIFNKPAASL